MLYVPHGRIKSEKKSVADANLKINVSHFGSWEHSVVYIVAGFANDM